MKVFNTVIITILFTFDVYGQSSLNISNQQFRTQFLDKINATRARGCNCGGKYMPPAPPIMWNNKLANAAMEHAKDMYRHNSLTIPAETAVRWKIAYKGRNTRIRVIKDTP